jgi:hypothetical protein
MEKQLDLLASSKLKPRLSSDSFPTWGVMLWSRLSQWIMVELGEHCHTHIIPRLGEVFIWRFLAMSLSSPEI